MISSPQATIVALLLFHISIGFALDDAAASMEASEFVKPVLKRLQIQRVFPINDEFVADKFERHFVQATLILDDLSLAVTSLLIARPGTTSDRVWAALSSVLDRIGQHLPAVGQQFGAEFAVADFDNAGLLTLSGTSLNSCRVHLVR